jgi:hypothetical protein
MSGRCQRLDVVKSAARYENPVAPSREEAHRCSMTPDEARPEVSPNLRRHVEHVFAHLLRPGELEQWEFRWERDAGSGRSMLLVDLVACGETYIGYLTEDGAGYPLEDGLDTFTDGLEDFISESRFAWGQQRLLTDRPWRAQER